LVDHGRPAIKCIFKLGYREASGIAEDYERQYSAENTPNFRTIQSLVPVHINSSGISPHRKLRVEEQLGVIRRRGRNRNIIPPKEIRKKNQEKWKRESGYHMRSIVEGVFSVFKNTFGEYTFSKTKEMREKELMLKALVYNRYIA